MNVEKVWITGLGVISAAGGNVEETIAAFQRENPQPAPVDLFSTAIACPAFQAALPLSGRSENYYESDRDSVELSRTCRLALTAAGEALANAGSPHLEPGFRLGVCLGTTVASQLNNLEFYERFRRTSHPPLDPVLSYLKGNLAEVAGRFYRVKGPRATVVNACSSGAEAIGVGAAWLRAGLCDAVIAGGADELNLVPFCGFHSLGVMSALPCRPFDRARQGLNLGEGAGVVLLERDSSVRTRGWRSELSVAGFGAACDAYHLTAPHPDGRGLELAVRAALREAGLNAADIAFVNAHGTATVDNDQVEGRVLARLFGTDTVCLSTKGYTGHSLGAAGGMEAVFTALALKQGWLPASAGLKEPDPAVSIVPLQQKTMVSGDAALSTSLAFGGNNAAVIICREPAVNKSSAAFSGVRKTSFNDQTAVIQPIKDKPTLPGMMIESMGMIGHFGRGVNSFKQVLQQGWRPPVEISYPGLNGKIKAYSISPELLQDRKVLKNMRRADRFCKMAVLAASDAWRYSDTEVVEGERTGLVLATGLGPHERTFEFLDGILDFGQEAVSPTAFSHSVHNAAASYIAGALRLNGPVMTLTDFDFAFPQALYVADSWLREKRVDTVLAGAVDELGSVMLHVCARLMQVPADGCMRPLAFARQPLAVPGEGSVFFKLTRRTGKKQGNRVGHGRMVSIEPGKSLSQPDLTIFDCAAMCGSEEDYLNLLPVTGGLANYSPLAGSMMTSMAWQCAAAALSLQENTFYNSPLGDHGSHPLATSRLKQANNEINNAVCCKLDGNRELATVTLAQVSQLGL